MTSPSDRSARAILDLAAQLDAAERRIRDEILLAAQRGDTGRIIEIVTRWNRLPPLEVLADGPRG